MQNFYSLCTPGMDEEVHGVDHSDVAGRTVSRHTSIKNQFKLRLD